MMILFYIKVVLEHAYLTIPNINGVQNEIEVFTAEHSGYRITDNTLVTRKENENGSLVFSTGPNDALINSIPKVTDIDSLTEDQRKIAILLYYGGVSSFKVKFSVGSDLREKTEVTVCGLAMSLLNDMCTPYPTYEPT